MVDWFSFTQLEKHLKNQCSRPLTRRLIEALHVRDEVRLGSNGHFCSLRNPSFLGDPEQTPALPPPATTATTATLALTTRLGLPLQLRLALGDAPVLLLAGQLTQLRQRAIDPALGALPGDPRALVGITP